jgi:FkbM family methyltransferase
MALDSIIRTLLRRPFFNGQDRIFNFLFRRNKLQTGFRIVTPLNGNFKIECDTNTWIGARVVFIGDYEPNLKKIFKKHIKTGDSVLDIGANIGFHTLYFSELVGPTGKVLAFEPVPSNFEKLTNNITLNNYQNIKAEHFALGNKNELMKIAADEKSINPGAFNLFDQSGTIEITCKIGDEVIGDNKVDFIKIDVEGYESFVIEGLANTIKKNRPTIVFEYDLDYQRRTGLPDGHIFDFLNPLRYSFFLIKHNGLENLASFDNIKSGNILAIPNV